MDKNAYLCSPILKYLLFRMKEFYYKVAGHVFVLQAEEQDNIVCELGQYEPFRTDRTEDVKFKLKVVARSLADASFHEEMRQQDEGQEIVAGHLSSGVPYFEFWLGSKRSSVLVTNSDYTEGEVGIEHFASFGLNNAIMVLYALATANSKTALFHSSVVSYQGRGYMFLGTSGTGKSTHSSLWLKHIEGTELVNDDNPVVRIDENNEVRVYGSPWSGKTPCYRNVSYPLGALVKLEQAKVNEISQLKGVRAYAVVVASISGKRWDKNVAEGLHETENLLAQLVPMWHLKCLPDEAAARLSCKTCAHER